MISMSALKLGLDSIDEQKQQEVVIQVMIQLG